MQVTEIKPNNETGFDPNRLLNAVIIHLQLKNDAALCRVLGVAPPILSKIRHRRLSVGASILVRILEVTDFSLRDLRTIMGDRREKYRANSAQLASVLTANNIKNKQNLGVAVQA